MDKLKHILYYTFIFMPIMFVCGLGIIIVDDKEIFNFQFYTKKLKKTKKQIDKEKFAKFMKRVTK